jgi:glutamate-ammonia-ligase adenylyltransferase
MTFGEDTRVRTTDIGEALRALHDQGYLEQTNYEVLLDGYLFLRRLEQRMHVVHGIPSTVIDAEAPALTKLARRMGMGDSSRTPPNELLLTRYRDVTEGVRAAYQSVLGIS